MTQRNATAVIVGAGDYIGAEIAKKFAAEGFTVFLGRRQGESSSRSSRRSRPPAARPSAGRSMRAMKTRSSS